MRHAGRHVTFPLSYASRYACPAVAATIQICLALGYCHGITRNFSIFKSDSMWVPEASTDTVKQAELEMVNHSEKSNDTTAFAI